MILTAVVMFVLVYGISAYDSMYSELEYLKGSCYPRDSCKLPRGEDNDHLWGNYTCECGGHCVRYGTCCADSPHFGKMLHVQYRGEACHKLSNMPDSVVTVFRCSDRWHYGFQVRETCEKPEFNMEDPVTMTPATSLITQVTYKNYFCAVCNYDADVVLWNVSLQLEARQSDSDLSIATQDYMLQNMVYNEEEKSWGVYVHKKFYKMKLQFKVPSSLQKLVKKCHRHMITQCDPSFNYTNEMEYKCLSYYSPIQLKEKGSHIKKYRNIHCAICNNINLNATEMDSSICKMGIDSRKPAKPTFSFALLLDINSSDGDLVGKKQLCGDGEKWDPFFKKCRSLSCALPGRVIRNGECVES